MSSDAEVAEIFATIATPRRHDISAVAAVAEVRRRDVLGVAAVAKVRRFDGRRFDSVPLVASEVGCIWKNKTILIYLFLTFRRINDFFTFKFTFTINCIC